MLRHTSTSASIPMDRRRGEAKNGIRCRWPNAGHDARARHDRARYAGEVKQIITGSIGFDDWEWGVDLFCRRSLVFKRLIYDMRFVEVSAVYALFGSFYVGVRFRPKIGQAAERLRDFRRRSTLIPILGSRSWPA